MQRMYAVPPPGTIPSSIAARVAESASSTRCCFSFCSTSVAAPTFMSATPPVSFARRSLSFSLSKSLLVTSSEALISLMRLAISLFLPPPSTISVASFVETTLRALPKSSIVAFSSFKPTSSVITRAPVSAAMSLRISLRRSPKAGALMASVEKVPRSLLRTSVGNASPSTFSQMITSSLRPAFARLSRSGRIS